MSRQRAAGAVGNSTGSSLRHFDADSYFRIAERHCRKILPFCFSLAHGAGNDVFYYGDWIRKPGVAICSCNDGLRPVIFKLESTDNVASIEYEPVR